MGTLGTLHGWCEPCLSEKAERGGGGIFCQSFQEWLFLVWNYTLGDQLCSKCMRKSFVNYPVNEIEAFKDNNPNDTSKCHSKYCYSNSRDISMYCGKAAYRSSTCTMILCPIVQYMWVFRKVEKVGNLRKIFGYEESECGGVPRPSFPGPSRSPSQLVLLRGPMCPIP